MSPMINIIFLSVHDSLFETPPTVDADEFQTVGVDAGVSAVSDEFFAVSPGSGAVEFIGTEGVAFLSDEAFVVSHVGFVDTSEDYSGSDVAAYEPVSVVTGGFGSIASKWFDLDF